MELLDLALRSAAIGVLALLAGLLLRAPIGWEGRISILAVALSKSAMLLLTSATPLAFPPLIATNLILLSSLVPNAVTWLIVTIFVDPPFRRWPWLVASSLVSGLLLVHHLNPDSVAAVLCAASAALLYAGLFGLALWSSRDDLVECRCRARPGFAAAIAGLGATLTGVQALGLMDSEGLAFALMQSTGVLAVTLAFAIWILNPAIDRWPGQSDTSPAPEPSSAGPDTALITRIRAAMAAGAWRQEGLTIGGLAAQLNVPEHRLRRAINGGLGHRNFSSFINSHRIAAAKAQLADPEGEGTTILEIAYDVGFASLGPFNRAFRAATGQSPTEFRRDALSHPAARADSENRAPIPANLH
ncbi:helix-turn-helix domain-containing protein [Hasllibacter sp. MH4015]|uniref:helix-turn-helix domain-containing protein n=1 Tax=Hasllibacter sp. MH4015 TaxID=2854029 RepID=UPI001CD617E6|nr:helix-turn-helix domain-containing protein [Hasllibacter sp. MH4015]